MKKIIISSIIAIFLIGCSANNRNVITTVQSGIGIKLDYRQDTQMPVIWLGYIRSFSTIVPVQLNTVDPALEDASKAIHMYSSMDCSVGIIHGIKIRERMIFNGDNTNDQENVKAVFGIPTAKFLER